MTGLRRLLEKPYFICLFLSIVYGALFLGVYRHYMITDVEAQIQTIILQFAESTFPPKMVLIKNLPDWGHAGYYAFFGGISKILKINEASEISKLRAVGLVLTMISFFIFTKLGLFYSKRTRLNPFWISLSLLLFAANPYSIISSMFLSFAPLYFVTTLYALYFFEVEDFKWSSIFVSLAILVDWRALILAIVFVIVHFMKDKSKLVRPDRGMALTFPFIISALQIIAWKGFIPMGDFRELWSNVRGEISLFHFDGLFYSFALIPIYVLYFSWNWALRARIRAIKYGLFATAILIPIYFIFPIHFDLWNQFRFHLDVPLGYIDQGAVWVAGEYKNILLFIPWFLGTFLFMQLIQRDIDEQSRAIWLYCILYFFIQPFLSGLGGGGASGVVSSVIGDSGFLLVAPFLLLYTISESLVGEEGNLLS